MSPIEKLMLLKQQDGIEMLEIQIEMLKSNLEFLKQAKEDRKELGISDEKVFDCFLGGATPTILTIFPSKVFIIEYLFQTIQIPFKLLEEFLVNLKNEDYIKMLISSIEEEVQKK